MVKQKIVCIKLSAIASGIMEVPSEAYARQKWMLRKKEKENYI